MAFNVRFDEFRRDVNAVPIFVVYVRLSIGGLLFIQDAKSAVEMAVGDLVGDHLPADVTLDEKNDVLIQKDERLVNIYDIEFGSLQENNSIKRVAKNKRSGRVIKLDNSDHALSRLWANESLLGREVYVKLGFIGLPYGYFQEVDRGVIISTQYDFKKVVNLSLE